MKKKSLVLITMFSLSFVNVGAALSKRDIQTTNYKTFFGYCHSRVAGKLTLKLVKEFEKTKSLKNIKDLIIDSDLKTKYFLKDYKISFNPLTNLLNFSFDCPRPLTKVQIYKDNGIESYSAILVDNSELFDPTYEVLLRTDGKLKHSLPSLALPVGDLSDENQIRLTGLINQMGPDFQKNLSEIILTEENELTIILSLRDKPSSAFLGKDSWEEKVMKLKKIVSYMDEKKKIPSIINLTNAKKVVVKFSDKF